MKVKYMYTMLLRPYIRLPKSGLILEVVLTLNIIKNKSAAGIAWCPATALTSSEVTVLNLCTSSSHALYCTKFWEIIWNDIKVIEWTWFLYWKFQREIILQKDTISILTIYKITKWHKTEKTVAVTVHNQSLVILYLYQVSWNDLKPYQSYRADTISMPEIKKGNNSANNVSGVTTFNLCKMAGHALYVPSFVKLSRTVSKL